MNEALPTPAWRAQLCSTQGTTKAYLGARSLMDDLKNSVRSLNFDSGALQKQWGGKMFGVLYCVGPQGTDVFLRAFSGILDSKWSIEDWAPPCFKIQLWREEEAKTDPKIKAIENQLRELDPQGPQAQSLREKRKTISQHSMKVLHKLYRFQNSHGVELGLYELYQRDYNIPSGSGDCCAPKLLTWASERKLLPQALYEFYWGCTNRSESRQQGNFYPSCALKCSALVPFFGGITESYR